MHGINNVKALFTSLYSILDEILQRSAFLFLRVEKSAHVTNSSQVMTSHPNVGSSVHKAVLPIKVELEYLRMRLLLSLGRESSLVPSGKTMRSEERRVGKE